ncbi:uncharacterized protein LOC135946088 isoform X1 [Cloeon dipterum]|uniref:uncharacterized protein LOC135946088 isoform X1 n=1 Tax=Cloeon dipterum TaxID=197152 RepID=UPI0032203F74
MRQVWLMAFLGLVTGAAGQFNPDSFVGRLVVSAIKHTVQKRSLPEIMGMVSGIAGNVPSLAILGPNGGINLPEILNTVLPVFGEASDGVRCCKIIQVPDVFMENLVTCIIEPANAMGQNISARKSQGLEENCQIIHREREDYFHNDSVEKFCQAPKKSEMHVNLKWKKTSMIHPPVSFKELSTLMQSELCAMKCTFQKENKLGNDGLPNKELMLDNVNAAFKPEAVETVKLAIEACDKEMRISQKSLEQEMSEEDKCWASNAMVGCLVEKFHEHCPPESRIAGSQCLGNLGSKFWGDLPRKLKTIINDFKGNLMKK